MAMDCLGLALVWEGLADLRTRIRDEKRVLVYSADDKYCKPNRINATTNAIILKPVLKRLGQTTAFRLPHLEDLTREMTTLFEKTGLPTGEKKAYKASVELKKLAGFVKRRASRKEVTKDCSSENKAVVYCAAFTHVVVRMHQVTSCCCSQLIEQ